MKKYQLLVVFASLLAVTPVAFAQNNYNTVSEVKQAIEKFNAAFLKADVDQLASMLTNQYIHSNSGSAIITKKTWLNYIKKRRKQLDSRQLRVNSYDTSELVIKTYANSAVANGLVVVKGIRNKKPFQSKIRFTHLWIKENGVWKRAAFHDSKLK